MAIKKPRQWQQSGLTLLWVSALVFVLDQASKQWVFHHVAYLSERIAVLPFFNIVNVHNYGAAFSFLSEQAGWQKFLFLALALGISAALTLMLRRQPKQLWRINLSFALIIGGALGNAVDRIWLGAVVDFLDIYYQNYHWPAFNLADSAIVLGALLMVFDSLFTAHGQEK